MAIIELTRVQGDYGFEAKDENGYIVRMDSSPETGGQNFGARPMQLLLTGLAGCASIDVISILKKQKQEIDAYKVIVNGTRETGKEPALWKNIEIEFHLYGNVDEEKARKAVALSLEKYCSVAATLIAAGASINSNVIINMK
ncbi:MAG: OsmC family protein [Chitinophagaceae bacterium]|jgi:putative redox protein|nr:OsmC family protein [Chitinophagaceae bacterium]